MIIIDFVNNEIIMGEVVTMDNNLLQEVGEWIEDQREKLIPESEDFTGLTDLSGLAI